MLTVKVMVMSFDDNDGDCCNDRLCDGDGDGYGVVVVTVVDHLCSSPWTSRNILIKFS